jgi:hypothetical protein
MNKYDYDVDSYLLKKGEKKATISSESFDNYPDAMTFYRDAKDAILRELETNEIEDWFVTISRVYIKGTVRRNENLKHDGTI